MCLLATVLAAGYDDGYLVLFNVESGKVLHRANVAKGTPLTSLRWTSVGLNTRATFICGATSNYP
jgi:hypothetical protein